MLEGRKTSDGVYQQLLFTVDPVAIDVIMQPVRFEKIDGEILYGYQPFFIGQQLPTVPSANDTSLWATRPLTAAEAESELRRGVHLEFLLVRPDSLDDYVDEGRRSPVSVLAEMLALSSSAIGLAAVCMLGLEDLCHRFLHLQV